MEIILPKTALPSQKLNKSNNFVLPSQINRTQTAGTDYKLSNSRRNLQSRE